MSIASPTFRSSSSTVPGPSLRRSLISIRARPRMAETLTGTSNPASRSAALRVVDPSGSDAGGTSASAARSSRLGSGTLPSSLILATLRVLCCIGHAAARADIAGDGFADCGVGRDGVAIDAAVRPFDPAVAGPDAGVAEHDEPPLEAVPASDVVELLAGGGIGQIVDAYGNMRRGDQLAETAARKRRNFRKRLALEQGRRELAGNRDRDLDGFAFKPCLDRPQRVVGFAEARGNVFKRSGNVATGLDGRVALRLGIAAAVRRSLGLGQFHRVFGKGDRRFAF